LSGIDLNKIKLGATVDLDEYEKDNPRDFTLFKRCRLSELKRGIYVKTDWGNVRPSWHIQCAAMSMKYLGENFDIHTSSRELIFPHHENEIAIATALTGKPLAKYWIHCDRVLVDGKKVNENGIRLTLHDLKERGRSGRELRFWLISTHYRKRVIFSEDRLNAARNSLERLDTFVHTLSQLKQGDSYPELSQLLYDIRQGFVTAMDDDLNISAAMASIFRNIRKINILTLENRISREDASKITEVFRSIDSVLKIFDFGEEISDSEIRELLAAREKARSEKNWPLADSIREQLEALGVTVRDGKR
jgi:cysteinyl-tRNA synthetase